MSRPLSADVPGIGVAVIDSGVNVPHPHLPFVAGGVGFDLEGNESGEYVDRLGHGTAAAAAIREKAPEAHLWAVKVFDRQLATTVRTLVRAIDWATARGLRLINLSLGTPHAFRASELAPAVARAVEAGSIIVSAHRFEDQLWYPGSMKGVVGVMVDVGQPRDAVRVTDVDGRALVIAAPYPRPIPGVPVERNLNGISFAVANATGCLARLLADRPEVRTAEEAVGLLETTLRPGPG